MGSPGFAVPALRALHAAGHDIAAVYCQPPRPAGRGQHETPCPAQLAARELGLEVRTPARLRRDEAAQAGFAALDLDAAVVAAYGLILPRAMLEAPRRGCLNIHASLLPRWRGASPIQHAILHGDAESGVTIMRMDEGLDTGPMLLREAVALPARVTTPWLHDRLAEIGARLILRALAEDPPAMPQPADGVTLAPKLGKADAALDFGEDAAAVDARIRAMNPWPGAYFPHGGEALRVLEAEPGQGSGPPGTVLHAPALTVACGRGALRITRLQRPGRAALDAEAFLRGFPLPPGTRLGA
jgi:methionyl-tRNA formyltransferase